MSLQQFKIVVGSDNDVIYEDPVLGSNGTAVVTKINGLIDAIDLYNEGVVPLDKGYLVTRDNTQVAQLPPGPARFCLVSSPSSPLGLAYEERVDLTSNQTIVGNKSFTGTTSTATLNSSGPVNITGVTNAANVNLANLVGSGTASIGGATTLASSLSVGGVTNLQAALNVNGPTLLRSTLVVEQSSNLNGPTTVGATLSVAGSTSIGSNLNVSGLSSLNGAVSTNSTLTVSGNILGNSGLSLVGNANVGGGLQVAGPSVIDDNLTVTGTLTTNDLSILDDLSVGGDLSVVGSTNTTGPISTTASMSTGAGLSVGTNLQVQGSSNLVGDVLAGRDLAVSRHLEVDGNTSLVNLTANQASVVSDVVIGGSLEVGESLAVDGPTSISSDLAVQGTTNLVDLVVSGSTDLETLSAGNTLIDGNLTTSSNLTVGGSALVSNDLTVEGNSSTDGNSSISGNLGVIGNTSTSNLTATNVSASGLLSSGSLVTFTAQVNGDLEVVGTSTLQDDVEIGGSLLVDGDINGNNLSGINTGDEEPATPTLYGVVKIDSASADPTVYLKSTIDNTFLRLDSVGVDVVPLSNNKIPLQYLPPQSITNVSVVNSEAEMLALTAESGDVAVRLDESKTYILRQEPSSDLSNWQEVLTPLVPVISVHGRVGAVVSAAGDYSATQIDLDNSSLSLVLSTNLQQAVSTIDQLLEDHFSNNSNPHSTTAQQVGAIPTTEKGMQNGVASLDSNGVIEVDQLPSNTSFHFSIDFEEADLVDNKLEVIHDLGKKRLSSVTVWNNADKIILPDDVLAIDSNTLSIDLTSFNTPSPIIGVWTISICK